MAKYYDSDYARNRNSENIVYKDANNEIFEISLEEYLIKNPEKTKGDFIEIKRISDDMFHDNLKLLNRENNQTVSIDDVGESISQISISTHQSIETQEERRISKFEDDVKIYSFIKLIASGVLTEKQIKRGILHFFEKLSFRDIGKIEGVSHIAIKYSIDEILKQM